MHDIQIRAVNLSQGSAQNRAWVPGTDCVLCTALCCRSKQPRLRRRTGNHPRLPEPLLTFDRLRPVWELGIPGTGTTIGHRACGLYEDFLLSDF